MAFRLPDIRPRGIIISSVVPEIDGTIKNACRKKYGIVPTFVTHRNAGIRIDYPRPDRIGADRLVNVTAAWKKYRRACLVIDMGTATTFDFVDSRGRYIGGPIVAGMDLMALALFAGTSKLPYVRPKMQRRIFPRSTKEAIEAGLFYGYIGILRHMISVIAKKCGKKAPLIIMTGGLSRLFSKDIGVRCRFEPNLMFEGLKLIHEGLKK
jgi:type III pantothenate kinase